MSTRKEAMVSLGLTKSQFDSVRAACIEAGYVFKQTSNDFGQPVNMYEEVDVKMMRGIWERKNDGVSIKDAAQQVIGEKKEPDAREFLNWKLASVKLMEYITRHNSEEINEMLVRCVETPDLFSHIQKPEESASIVQAIKKAQQRSKISKALSRAKKDINELQFNELQDFITQQYDGDTKPMFKNEHLSIYMLETFMYYLDEADEAFYDHFVYVASKHRK
jgi:hypothetical protein